MFATDRFIFLHLHKSGGTFVIDFLRKFVPELRQIGYHLPRRVTPPALTHLPALGLVRNPWSYYVSWYFFQKQKQKPNPLFKILSDNGRLGFVGTVENMLNLGNSPELLNKLIEASPATYLPHGANLPGFVFAEMRGFEHGFYTYLYKYMYEGPGMLSICKLELLREDLLPMLVALGQPVSQAMRAYIQDQAALNASEHDNYTSYFSDDLKNIVLEKDAEIIQRYGYRYE